MRAVNIEWDTTDMVWEHNNEPVDLPNEVYIPAEVGEDEVADYLSDEYGFCVESFDLI